MMAIRRLTSTMSIRMPYTHISSTLSRGTTLQGVDAGGGKGA